MRILTLQLLLASVALGSEVRSVPGTAGQIIIQQINPDGTYKLTNTLTGVVLDNVSEEQLSQFGDPEYNNLMKNSPTITFTSNLCKLWNATATPNLLAPLTHSCKEMWDAEMTNIDEECDKRLSHERGCYWSDVKANDIAIARAGELYRLVGGEPGASWTGFLSATADAREKWRAKPDGRRACGERGCRCGVYKVWKRLQDNRTKDLQKTWQAQFSDVQDESSSGGAATATSSPSKKKKSRKKKGKSKRQVSVSPNSDKENSCAKNSDEQKPSFVQDHEDLFHGIPPGPRAGRGWRHQPSDAFRTSMAAARQDLRELEALPDTESQLRRFLVNRGLEQAFPASLAIQVEPASTATSPRALLDRLQIDDLPPGQALRSDQDSPTTTAVTEWSVDSAGSVDKKSLSPEAYAAVAALKSRCAEQLRDD